MVRNRELFSLIQLEGGKEERKEEGKNEKERDGKKQEAIKALLSPPAELPRPRQSVFISSARTFPPA